MDREMGRMRGLMGWERIKNKDDEGCKRGDEEIMTKVGSEMNSDDCDRGEEEGAAAVTEPEMRSK